MRVRETEGGGGKLYHPSACGLEISDIKEKPKSGFREIMKIKESYVSTSSSPSLLFPVLSHNTSISQ